MNPVLTLVPFRSAAPAQPCPALEERADAVAVASGEVKRMGEVLTELLNAESALYGITREWRYDTVGRKFLRLRALLDEQFSEIGVRLTRLAARSRDLGARNSTGQSERSAARTKVADVALQAHMIRELLSLHEALIAGLKRGSSAASDQFHDRETNVLLADLTAEHEKDAFMLRALLWEVQNFPA